MKPIDPSGAYPLDVLRRFAKPKPKGARCELCSADLASEHEHLIEPGSRQLHCCCSACAILFSVRNGARFLRVPRRIESLADFHLSDLQWESLHLPISLAFFYRNQLTGQVSAFYPSPAGATESLLPLDAWRELEDENPVLLELEPEVEALLVNRVENSRESYRVPIDECYKLVGLLRTHWRGFSGGAEVWMEVERFFDQLRDRAHFVGGAIHA
jgi:hypothetical protein